MSCQFITISSGAYIDRTEQTSQHSLEEMQEVFGGGPKEKQIESAGHEEHVNPVSKEVNVGF